MDAFPRLGNADSTRSVYVQLVSLRLEQQALKNQYSRFPSGLNSFLFRTEAFITSVDVMNKCLKFECEINFNPQMFKVFELSASICVSWIVNDVEK